MLAQEIGNRNKTSIGRVRQPVDMACNEHTEYRCFVAESGHFTQ